MRKNPASARRPSKTGQFIAERSAKVNCTGQQKPPGNTAVVSMKTRLLALPPEFFTRPRRATAASQSMRRPVRSAVAKRTDSPASSNCTSTACKLDVHAPESTLALTAKPPNSGSAIHSRLPITIRVAPDPEIGSPSSPASAPEAEATGTGAAFKICLRRFILPPRANCGPWRGGLAAPA